MKNCEENRGKINGTVRIFNDRNKITLLKVDCTNYLKLFSEILTNSDVCEIEEMTLNLCYRLHNARLKQMVK